MSDNVEVTIKNGKLTAVVDLSQNFGPSSTNKSDIIGSTHGFVKLSDPDGVSYMINVIKAKPKAK